MNKAKKWLVHVLALAMVISSISVLSFGQQTKSEAASGSFQNLNQSQFVSAMGIWEISWKQQITEYQVKQRGVIRPLRKI